MAPTPPKISPSYTTPPDTPEIRAEIEKIALDKRDRFNALMGQVADEHNKATWDAGYRAGVEATLKALGAWDPIFSEKPTPQPAPSEKR